MKKDDLMKGMAVMALAVASVSCSHDLGEYDQTAREQESAISFVNNVLGGQEVDANQNWSTATSKTITVNSEIAEGKLKVYTVDPIGQNSAPLYTTTIKKGEQKSFQVACPNDAKNLFVAVYDEQNYLRTATVNTANESLNVSFKAEEKPATSRGFRAPGNYYQNSHQFATAPADDDFATSVPEGALPEDNCNGGGWGVNVVISHATVNYLNLWNAGSNVYFPAGNWVVNGQYVGNNSKVYLLPGANVTFNGEYNLNSENAALYIANGATFTAQKISYNFKLYNRGTINVGELSQYANGWIYNEGTINATGEIGPKNNFSEIVNATTGVINGTKLTVQGSGHFLNEGKVELSDDVVINSNNLSWVNNGYFHCKNFTYEAGSWNVINNCKLVVDELFFMNLGDSQGEFKLDGSIECKNYTHGIGWTKMAPKSVIKVVETLLCKAMADGRYYGFYGPESDANGYAAIQAKKITAETLTQRRSITYRNYLIVATDDHWKQCDQYDSSVNGNYPYWDQGDNVKMAKSQTDIDITIEPTDCNAGISGEHNLIDEDGELNEPTQYFYYAFEDLGTIGDFDFNDVVLRVSAPVNGQSKVEVVAAGGTMETKVFYGLGDDPIQLGGEVHAVMGASDYRTMLNTQSVDPNLFKVLGTIPVSENTDMANLPLSIHVTGNGGETTKVTRSVENKGKAPLVIVVNGDPVTGKWFWPTERTNITIAYEDFGAWGANVSSNADWYRTPTGAVVSY